MSVKIKFPDQPMEDGTIPELTTTTYEGMDKGFTMDISDECATWGWLSSIDAPMATEELAFTIDFSDKLPTPEQTQKILEAMANLMVVVSRVGYEMAQAKHEGGEGYED
jgi:hypothetical protein